MLKKFWNSLCLLKFDRTEGPKVIQIHPEDNDSLKTKKSFLACSFTENQVNFNSIYSFSIHKSLCHTWEFVYESEIYSIVIVVKNSLSYLYLQFLKSCKKQFSEDKPEDRLTKIKDLLNEWSYDSRGVKIRAHYPDEVVTVHVDQQQGFYPQFDPSSFISSNRLVLEEIFHTILLNKGVLIVGDSAEMVSSAGYALMSIFEPLKFTDPYLLYTRLGDTRFAEVINGNTKWKFVGTTNKLVLERCKQFRTVVRLPPKSTPIIQDIKPYFYKKCNRFVRRIENQFNRHLEVDPYSDIIESPLTKREIKEVCYGLEFSPDDLKDFFNSNMFCNWRKTLLIRDQLREALLSFPPSAVVEKHTDEQLELAESFFTNFLDNIAGDTHLIAVIKMHLKLIRKRLAHKDSSNHN